MAQRARFGRLPRSAPSLTSTIVALAQEYQHTRDRNIETAWKDGGLFEGKKVTDQAFLKHWQDRLADVSKDDPMWDYYNNLIYSYQFMVDESKMGLKYARKDVTDGQMAAFYAKWARKMPMNSENYRQLMTQAAKFKAASTARANSGNAQAARDRYDRRQQHTFASKEQPYDTAVQLITNFAVTQNILDRSDVINPDGSPTKDHGWKKLTNADGENDPANFANLLSDIMANDDLRARMTAVIKQYNPDFSGVFNEETLTNMANTARDGAGIRAHRAQKAGDKTGYNAADEAAANYALQSAVTRASLGGPGGAQKGFIEQNEYQRAQLDAVIGEGSHASDQEQAIAIQKYGKWLAGEGSQALVTAFPKGSFDELSPNFDVSAAGMLGRIQGTLDALNGKPSGKTLKDDTLGLSTSEAGTGSDAVKLSRTSQNVQTAVADVAAGRAVVVKTDIDGNITPKGEYWSTIQRTSPKLLGKDIVPFASASMGSIQMADGTMVGGAAGETRYVQAEEVRARVSTAQDPRTGAGLMESKPIGAEDPVLGKHISYIGPGGSPIDLWSVQVNGREVWTHVDPFSTANRGTSGSAGDGKYVIDYLIPGGGPKTQLTGGAGTGVTPYKPSSFITNVPKYRTSDGKDSSDGTPWDDNTDKETGYFSPMAAAAHSSSAAMQYAAGLGDAIAASEREWYSQDAHMTPEMQQAIAAGADRNSVIDAQSQVLMQTINFNKTYGFTPEDQQRNRSAEAQAQLAVGAAQAGVSVAEFKARQGMLEDESKRQDLISQVNKWGQTQRTMTVQYGGKVPGQGQVPGGGEQTKIGEWAKKGWTVADLLSQPGMSFTQANDLAAQITNGVVGQRGAERTGKELPWSHPTYSSLPVPNRPYVNPYLATGQVTQKPLGPAAPAPVKPAPEVKPKAVSGKLVKETFSGTDWGVQLQEGGPTAY